MNDEFLKMKKDFMKVKNGYEWNEFKERYPNYTFEDIDNEMKEHFNEILRGNATKEMLNNPHIHYEAKKKIRIGRWYFYVHF